MIPRFLYSMVISGVAASAAWGNAALYVSRHAAKILPHRIVSIPSPEAGEIRIHSLGEGRVAAGTLLAVLNEEQLALEEREVAMTIQQQQLERDKAILKLRKYKQELEFLKSLPAERRAFAQERLKTQIDEKVLTSVNQEIRLLEDKTALAVRKLQHGIEKKRQASTLTMPFSGRIQYHIPLPEKEGGSTYVTSSSPIATVIDDSAFYVVLPATDPIWSKLEHERLHLTIDLGAGDKLTATWHHQKVDKGERGETLFYYFILPQQDNDKAFSLIGSHIVIELFYTSEDDWLYEKKSALAMEAGATTFETWEKLVAALRPGYRIVFVGETHLCLQKKDERLALPVDIPSS